MHKYLPSKRFIYIILSIIIALGIIYIFSFFTKAKAPVKVLSVTEVKAKVGEFMALDSDTDGLKDWEEALYKTDPKNPDTDSDGTMDGAEVAVNRNPLKANTAVAGKEPTDKIDDKIIADARKATEDFKNLSDTEKMGRMMVSQYLATKKVGQTITEAEISSILENTMAQMPTLTIKQFSLTDIVTLPNTNLENIKQYGNTIAEYMWNDLLGVKIMNKDYDFYGLAEIDYLSQVMDQTTDKNEINEAATGLDPIIEKYNTLINNLLSVPAPSALADSHLTLINTFEAMYDNLTQMRMVSSDIATMIPLLNYMQVNINNFLDTMANTANIFLENKITFAPTDFGYKLFNDIITTN